MLLQNRYYKSLLLIFKVQNYIYKENLPKEKHRSQYYELDFNTVGAAYYDHG